MRVNYADLLFTLSYVFVFVFVAQIGAHSTSNGKGVYKTYNNAKKSLAALVTKKENSEKFLFGSVNDHTRAPSHDTPYSPCKCSK